VRVLMSWFDDSASILGAVRFVAWVCGCVVLRLVFVVDGEWLFVHREVEDYIVRRGTFPERPSRRISPHMHHVAIPNISRRK
jgi:hypothetical protein